jgi:hypothetical protein
MLKNVLSILTMVEEETVRPLFYWDAEEEGGGVAGGEQEATMTP